MIGSNPAFSTGLVKHLHCPRRPALIVFSCCGLTLRARSKGQNGYHVNHVLPANRGTDARSRDEPGSRTTPALRDATDPAPRVSVIVCSHNGAATLRGCLASLQALNYSNYEVILVDDGSTDGTPRIASNFSLVRTARQGHGGLGVARNVGAVEATGEIVAYADADCVVDADWLHHLISAMHHQDVDAIGGHNIKGSRLPRSAPTWCSAVVFALHVTQPAVRR